MLTFTIFVTTFAAVTLAVLYFGQRSTDTVRRRILEGATANDLARRRNREGSMGDRLIRPALGRLGGALSRMLPQHIVADFEKMLVRAGEPMSLSTFLSGWLLIGGAGFLAAALIVQGLTEWGAARFIIGGVIIFYTTLLPYLLIRRRAVRRTRRIEKELPDALDLMLTCVEAGLGVDAAFALVAERSRGPLAEAFRDYLRQVGLGRLRKDALEDIAERSGAQSMNRLATTVAQSTAVGTSMGDVLRLQAAELRETRRLRAEEQASRAPILMTIPLALCFMPAMIAVAVVPAIFNLIDFVGGGFQPQ